MTPRVLVSDKLSETAVQIFRDRGVEVDYKPDLGRDKDALLAAIPPYDGLAIRSATKVSPKLIAAAQNLKVIGRAGIGVDNVDIPAATSRGIVVMNTPYGNAVTTAEHALSLMMALARQIPAANASTHAGKWEKNRFMGVELFNKTLGIIGCGNIGSIVADRALGLKMKVIAYDPFLSPERAIEIGVEKVELDDIFRRADFITLHAPLTDKTRNIIDAAAIAKMKKGVRIINCARGGLLVEDALYDALKSGHVAGAALDVFEEEPANHHKLFGFENVVATPHLGASTSEAQENVAIQIAEQMADYLLTGAVSNALNMPSSSIFLQGDTRHRAYARLEPQCFGGGAIMAGLGRSHLGSEAPIVAQRQRDDRAAGAGVGVCRDVLRRPGVDDVPGRGRRGRGRRGGAPPRVRHGPVLRPQGAAEDRGARRPGPSGRRTVRRGGRSAWSAA